MRSSRVTVLAIALATGIVAVAACSTTSTGGDDPSGSTSSASRTMTEVPGSPGCPQRTTLFCRISFGTPGGNQCAPAIVLTPMGGGTAFLWSSPSGQLVDAVVVNGEGSANVYAYSPPVSSDSELLVLPPSDGGSARLSRVDFCVAHDAGVDAAVDASADAPEEAAIDAAADAPSDAGGQKMW